MRDLLLYHKTIKAQLAVQVLMLRLGLTVIPKKAKTVLNFKKRPFSFRGTKVPNFSVPPFKRKTKSVIFGFFRQEKCNWTVLLTHSCYSFEKWLFGKENAHFWNALSKGFAYDYINPTGREEGKIRIGRYETEIFESLILCIVVD